MAARNNCCRGTNRLCDVREYSWQALSAGEMSAGHRGRVQGTWSVGRRSRLRRRTTTHSHTVRRQNVLRWRYRS